MAAEYPRERIWVGNNGNPLTFLVRIGLGERRYLVKSVSPGFAITSVLHLVGDSIEILSELNIEIRPLTSTEVKSVSLERDEVIELDELSYIHMIKENGEEP